MDLSWIQLGSLMMFLAVTLGAFGSHSIRPKLSDQSMEIYKTGVLYHFIHAIGIFIVAWLTTQSNDPNVHYAGLFFLLGICLFSGSLYLLSVTEIKWLAAFTPIGGILFLLGWAFLLTSQYRTAF